MITIWNRKELFTTFSMKKQAEIRSRLAANGIDYMVKTKSQGTSFVWSSRVRMGTFGETIDNSIQYLIYVRKNDYDQARQYLN